MYSAATSSSLVTVERLFDGRDVTPLFEDQEDLLPSSSPNGEDLCSCTLGVYLRLRSFQDIGVGLTLLLQELENVFPSLGLRRSV